MTKKNEKTPIRKTTKIQHKIIDISKEAIQTNQTKTMFETKGDFRLKPPATHQEDKIKNNTKASYDKIISFHVHIRIYVNIHSEKAGL